MTQKTEQRRVVLEKVRKVMDDVVQAWGTDW